MRKRRCYVLGPVRQGLQRRAPNMVQCMYVAGPAWSGPRAFQGQFVTLIGSSDDALIVWESNRFAADFRCEDAPRIRFIAAFLLIRAPRVRIPPGSFSFSGRHDNWTRAPATPPKGIIPPSHALLCTISPMDSGNLGRAFQNREREAAILHRGIVLRVAHYHPQLSV
jgi:hypothetical protein